MRRGRTKLDRGDTALLEKMEELRTRLLSKGEVRERISRRAYELYENRGGEHGREVEDWLEAENEVLSPLIEKEMIGSTETRSVQDAGPDASGTAEPPVKAAAAKKSKSRTPSKSETTRKRKAKTVHEEGR
jgi:Protein of unknown function (DUF2934)